MTYYDECSMSRLYLYSTPFILFDCHSVFIQKKNLLRKYVISEAVVIFARGFSVPDVFSQSPEF